MPVWSPPLRLGSIPIARQKESLHPALSIHMSEEETKPGDADSAFSFPERVASAPNF